MGPRSPVLVFATLLFALVLLEACDEKGPVGPTLRQPFTLAPGQAVAVQSTPLRVRFVRVSGDSRCPADAVCIQGGDAVVHLQATETTTVEYELHTGGPPRFVVTPSGFRIELVQLQPYPFSSRTIEPGEYRATLIVTR